MIVFKKGDRVRVASHEFDPNIIGKVGTVVDVDDEWYVAVSFDAGYVSSEGPEVDALMAAVGWPLIVSELEPEPLDA